MGIEKGLKITRQVGNTSPRFGSICRKGSRRKYVSRSAANDVGLGGKFRETVAKLYGGPRKLAIAATTAGDRLRAIQILLERDFPATS